MNYTQKIYTKMKGKLIKTDKDNYTLFDEKGNRKKK